MWRSMLVRPGCTVAFGFGLCTLWLPGAAHAAATCEDLAKLHLADTTVESAQEVSPAGLTGPYRAAGITSAFCRVDFKITPTADSRIRVALALPSPGDWNGKFLGTGNGGLAGGFALGEVLDGLKRGYATANTDMGMSVDPGRPHDYTVGIGHPERIVDFAWRSTHLMTVISKQIVAAYYGHSESAAYFLGCSTGGRQALTEAQRFPEDYIGIVGGDPANNLTHLYMVGVWAYKALHARPGDFLSEEKLTLLRTAAVEACDAEDGVKDGLIGDPTQCKFDPGMVECKAEENDRCLTKPQVEAARKLFAGPRNPRTGQQIFPGFEPGTVFGPNAGGKAGESGAALPTSATAILNWSAHWKGPDFDFDRDVATIDHDLGFLNATDADLRSFKNRGGKLLMYTGWADPIIAPQSLVDYYTAVEKKMGGEASTGEFARLYVVPGMGHCGGGPGPTRFDTLGAMDAWVTRGTEPGSILATHPATQSGQTRAFSRPLCPYPQAASWDGKGSIDDAASFACEKRVGAK